MQGKPASMQVIFTINGPGEISGWLYPLAQALKARCPGLRVVVCLLPCVYSTGAEPQVLAGLNTIDAVASVADSFALILRNRLPEGMVPGARTLVFHLGGEVALTVLLAKRLRAPLYAYAERPISWQFLFQKVFFSGLNALPARHRRDAALLVGELMVDSARLRRAAAQGAKDRRVMIGLFPGSREYMAGFMLPYYAVTVDALSRQRPGLDWVMARADFVRMAFLRDFPAPPENRTWQAQTLTYGEAQGQSWLQTPEGNRIRILPGREVLALEDFAITIPGTNTGEIGASGTPMVVVLPTYMGHEVPLPGLAGHLGRLPLIGRSLKLFFGFRVLRGLPLLAQPNRRAGRMIVPEFVGEGLHPKIEAALGEMLDSDTSALRAEIRDSMGRPGAAEALAGAIADFFAIAPPARL